MSSNSAATRTNKQLENQQTLEFAAELELRLRSSLASASFTTFQIGGSFAALFEIDTAQQAAAALKLLAAMQQPHRVLGAGSNLLLPDGVCRDWVFKLSRKLRYIEELSPTRFKAGGATPLTMLSRVFSEQGLSGLEFAGGIPGGLGGAVFMNAGAHGGEMSDVVRSVEVALPDGTVQSIESRDLQFSYRRSVLPLGSIVVSAELELVQGDAERVMKQRRENLAMRKATQPLTVPSAGSTFKNPPDAPKAAVLLEQAGLKGYSIGGAVVSEKHSNWVVNPDRSASAADVSQLIEHCVDVVFAESGVRLEPELVVWR